MSGTGAKRGRVVGRIEPVGSAPDPSEAYRVHSVALFSYFRRCGLPRPAAEDQLQAVFVVLLESLTRFDPARGTLQAFLFGIARNQRLAWRRKQLREEKSAPSPQRIESGVTRTTIVRQAVDRLPDEQRESLILREFHGFDYEEIARLQGVPMGTVRSRLFRARDSLRRQLRTGDEERP